MKAKETEKLTTGKNKKTMNDLEDQECVLNIRYDLPDELFKKLPLVYEKIPGWLGFGKDGNGEEGIPYWFSFNENEKSIFASVEPSGLQIVGNMEKEEWDSWVSEIKRIATEILEFKVGEIENGEVGYEIQWLKK